MDEEVPRPAEPADESQPAVDWPALPEAVSSDADELRQLIEAGASSPEELHALAARIREHRALEESVWRRDVRPALIDSKKRRFTLRDLADQPDGPRTPVGPVLALLGGVLVLVLAATQSSPLWVLGPVAAVLVYAYRQGKRAETSPDEGADSEGPAD